MAFAIDMEASTPVRSSESGVARVLLADDDLASRLTIKSILKTAGYAVDGAATASEAVARIDDGEYQLVLADLSWDTQDAGTRLLAYARQKDYRPATALISSRISRIESCTEPEETPDSVVSITDENVSQLLERVADLISHRADRRMQRAMRQAV
ncbi:MAG TPA: response regulator [Bryobacteraceae bacterium]|nr:response regulator [Bryobacteraceae bacterium]